MGEGKKGSGKMLEDERILALYWARDAAAIQETDVKYGCSSQEK